MSREDFDDITVTAARHIAERAWARIEHIEQSAKSSAQSPRSIEQAKHQIGRGAADTAKQVRKGTVRQKDIRGQVDFNAMGHAARAGRASPLFAVFANAVADNLKHTLQTDSDAEKLAEIEKALSQISMLEDWESLRRLDVELLNLGKRTEAWRERLTPSKEKVVQLKRLEGGRGG
jgi:hypothetical protein